MRPTDALCVCVPCGSDIAIALHTPPHRAISLALVAQALGATQGKGRLSRIIKALSTGSFSLPKGWISSRQKASSAKVLKAERTSFWVLDTSIDVRSTALSTLAEDAI